MRFPKPRPENRPSYVSLAVGVAGVAAVVTTTVLITPAPAGRAPVAAPVASTRGWTHMEEAVPAPAKPAAKPKPAATTKAKPKPHNAPAKPPAQRPGTVRLAAGGTANLVRTEVGADAVLPIPVALDQATWWGSELGDRTGATVLAGHVNYHGRIGPFNELWNAHVDDPVTIVDQQGHTMRFRVTQLVTLHKNELPQRAGELFSQKGPHRLVLVTCGGAWVGGAVGYASNRVVIADPVG